MIPVPPPWLARAQELARKLAIHRSARGLLPDVQRLFAWFPPGEPLGEGLFRLTEALPRTPDRAGRIALVMDHVRALRGPVRAALALPLARLGVEAVGRQFVYAEDIEDALRRGEKQSGHDRRRRFSFDMLGEGARTAEDAARGMQRYLGAVRAAGRLAKSGSGGRRRVGISIKLSCIHERFDAAGYSHARVALLDRATALCRAAAHSGIGLTIDAEESERAALQLDLFSALADQPELLSWDGLGMAVQAYRTAVLETVDAVVDIARRRRARGGASLAMRLVKGAYWDAEVKRAQELGAAHYAVYTDKRMTDLSYVRCSERLLQHADLVYAQFATHNPVSVACVLALAETRFASEEKRFGAFECQRLHGMGQGLDEALAAEFPLLPMRVYAPVGSRRELLAYLVRRLLENGASTSYVRKAAASGDTDALLAGELAFLAEETVSKPIPLPTELLMPARRIAQGYDLGDPATLSAIAAAVDREPRTWRAAPLIDGVAQAGSGRTVASPARPDAIIGEVVDATPGMADAAIASAHAYRRTWSATDVAKRAAILDRLADLIEADSRRLMALCVWEAGKTLADALADVREAVDFCRYYAHQARAVFEPTKLPGPTGETNVLSLHGRGVFACISPWNFPVAIFTGQVAAALVAGNTVVAKPAEQTSLAAFRIAELVLEAGVPRQAFHLLPGDGATVGKAMVEDPRIAGVAFTGSNETARAINLGLAQRSGGIVPFIAETGGLNAMIVDSTALPEQVVDAVVASAFRSAGQRCSSLRMLYVQEEIAPVVLEMLRGALASLRVGDPADPSTDIGPVIDEAARRPLARYVEELKARGRLIGECPVALTGGSFLAPVAVEIGSIGEIPGERFGPILHVARFAIEDLDRVVDEINAAGYGLTMGVHTRIDARAQQIRGRAAVGNLYVNRNMIGAVVGVQPFGGEGLSGTGPKAGGPHYLPRFAVERVYTVNTAAAGGDVQLVAASGL
jgi:RHH-type transcriptional regulator, proline utilization regulon repressor / proline dehydrogenase / delta 1-pyrroline-5-carboxylate dehydrogenase